MPARASLPQFVSAESSKDPSAEMPERLEFSQATAQPQQAKV